MKNLDKLLIALGIFFAFTIPVHRAQQIEHHWKNKEIHDYMRTVSVLFVSVEGGYCEGAGVVIDEDGTTLTVAHLFENHPKALQMLATNGNTYSLDLLAIDPRYDLALVRPKAASPTFKYAPLYSKDDVELNQSIMIIGHPLESFYNVQYGVILDWLWHPWYVGRILKISALVRPGNSGGPVFDSKGEVIGIVSAFHNDIFGKFDFGMVISPPQIKAFFKEVLPGKQHWPHQIRKYRLQDVKEKINE